MRAHISLLLEPAGGLEMLWSALRAVGELLKARTISLTLCRDRLDHVAQNWSACCSTRRRSYAHVFNQSDLHFSSLVSVLSV